MQTVKADQFPTAGRGRRALALFLCLAGASANAGVQFHDDFGPEKSGVLTRPRIEILGEIRVGDAKEVERLLPIAREKYLYPDGSSPLPDDPTVRPVVVLDSPGGNVLEALKIGRALRKSRAWVMTLPGRPCASACVLVLASGATRDVFGYELGLEAMGPVVKVGLHRPTFPPAQFAALSPEKAKAEYDRSLVLVRDYLAEMGMAQSLYQDMLSVASQDIDWITRVRAKAYGLDGEDPAFGEYVHAKVISHCGANFVEVQDAMNRCVASAHEISDIAACKSAYRRDVRGIESPCKPKDETSPASEEAAPHLGILELNCTYTTASGTNGEFIAKVDFANRKVNNFAAKISDSTIYWVNDDLAAEINRMSGRLHISGSKPPPLSADGRCEKATQQQKF